MRLALLLFAQCAVAASIVQSVGCHAAGDGAGGAISAVCVMPGNVAAGNLLVLVVGKLGGSCGTSDWSDTRSSVFTRRANVVNTGGFQSTTCIVTAPVTASGADTITMAGTQTLIMWAFEVRLIGYGIADTDTGIANSATSVATGDVVAAGLTLLVCGAANNSAALYDTVTPSGGTAAFAGPYAETGGLELSTTAAAYYKFVGAGTYTCTSTIAAAGTGSRMSSAALLISYQLGMFPLPSPIGINH